MAGLVWFGLVSVNQDGRMFLVVVGGGGGVMVFDVYGTGGVW